MQYDKASSYEYVSDSLASSSSNNNSVKSEFGNFQDTGDWVECESESFPGQTYFFNMRTHCTTWAKPVSHFVTLPRYRKHPRIYDKNFTCDIDNQPAIVSSESEDNCRSPITMSGRNFRRSPNEIIAWLYHGIDININDCFDDDLSHYTDSFISDTRDVLGDKQDSSASYNKPGLYEVGDHFLMNNDNFNKIRIFDGVVQNGAAIADYLEVKLSKSNDAVENADRIEPAADSNDDSLIVEKCIAFSSSSSENYHSYQLGPHCYAPRLPRMKSKYLQKEKLPVATKGRISKKKSVRKIPRKIVSEMYGTKTINYDNVELGLPPGVKRTNLSDSSATSSLWREERTVPTSNPTNFIDYGLRTNLSSGSTTSSSSSCTSCSCSTSSDTCQNSVSNTSK